ncbi:hypothetical protein ACQP3F_29785, partial [Escherichia coli]
ALSGRGHLYQAFTECHEECYNSKHGHQLSLVVTRDGRRDTWRARIQVLTATEKKVLREKKERRKIRACMWGKAG